MVVVCCVPFCGTSGDNGFHGFPANKQLQKLWVAATFTHFLEEKELAQSWRKICKKHFNDDDFETRSNGKTYLKKNRVPSRFLPSIIQLEHSYASSSSPLSPPIKKQRISENSVNHAVTSLKTLTKRSCETLSGTCVEAVENVQMYVEINNNVGVAKTETASTIKLEGYKYMMKTIRCKNRKLLNNQKKMKSLRDQIKYLKLNSINNIIEYITRKFGAKGMKLFEMHLKNLGRKPRGRRYSAEQKSFCLALYKQGPKSYRFLRKFICLPSKSTLGRYSAKLMFGTGISSKLFEFTKAKVTNMKDADKHCVLMWDEMALKSCLSYHSNKDIIDGFVEMANIRRPIFATHALVFMIRGINSSYKQPVAYFYTDGLKSFELVELIKLVSKAVFETGLEIMLSVCDQVSTNKAAVNKLIEPNCSRRKQNGELLQYTIFNKIVTHTYDPSHLIKGVRNNLLTKNLKHYIAERWNSNSKCIGNKKIQKKIASWDHVSELYKLSRKSSVKMLHKISDEHIQPKKKKMKVCVATQVFSATYGKTMLAFSKTKNMKQDSSNTAQALLFFNDLFDSVNCSGPAVHGKLKTAVTPTSIHFEYWEYALIMLQKMSFVDKLTGKVNNRSGVLGNFQSTLRGYIEICRKCFELNVIEISIRNLFQDALENFFGCIRSCCQIAVTPAPSHFRSAYGTLIVNNLNSKYSVKSNCEDDLATALLTDIQKLVMEDETIENYQNKIYLDDFEDNADLNDYNDFSETIVFDPLFCDVEINIVEEEALACDSSSICRKILQDTHCKNCRSTLEISSAENSIKVPSPDFIRAFKNIIFVGNDIMPQICFQKNVKKKLLSCIDKVINTHNIGCEKHNTVVAKKLKEFTVNYSINLFCKNVNKLLSGKVSELSDNTNSIEELALVFRQKKKHIGKHSDGSK